ncbi:MAG: class I SAM-dependent methyltransferase [Gemmatimonadales bacterium]|nr:MAG: class I SAM-dependent methyltransferase [Gemmatimonadales bacterium]
MRGIEQIPRLYDALMWVLDRVALGRWRRSLLAPVAEAGPRPPLLLDLGCGTGRNLPLAAPGTRAIGMDPDEGMLRAARRRAPGVPLVRARAEALPFRDDAFQVVVSSLVFCSVDDPGRGLGEVARVLAPGGTLRMLEHVRPRSRAGAWLAGRVQPAWTLLAGGCRPDRDTEAAVREAGFRIAPASLRSRWILRRLDASPEEGGSPAPRSPGPRPPGLPSR